MTWQDILNGIAKFVVGRPNYRPKPGPSPVPVKPPLPVPPVPPPTPVGPPIDGSTAVALYRAINAARAANGRPALALDAPVSTVSAAWAMRLAATGSLDHGDFVSRIASVRPGKAAGEDIGLGFPSASAEVQGWASDPAHAAILFGAYTAVGVGVGVGPDGRFVFCADFIE